MDSVQLVGNLIGGKSKARAEESRRKAEQLRQDRLEEQRREERKHDLAMSQANNNSLINSMSSSGGMSKQMPLILGGVGVLGVLAFAFKK